VEAVVFSCLGTAMVPFDRGGRPLAAAPAPADARPMAGPDPAERLGLDAAALRRTTGSDPRLASFLRHVLWWQAARPDVMGQVHRFRSLRGYLLHEWTGADVEDASWASRTMLMDLGSRDWSPDIVAAAGLASDVLPPIAASVSVWPVKRAVAARLGLAPRAVAVLGGMDNGCSLLGAADPGPRTLANIVGTYEHMAGAGSLDAARAAAAASDGLVHVDPLPGRYIAMSRVPVGELLAEVASASLEGLDMLLDRVTGPPQGLSIELDKEAVRARLRTDEPPGLVLRAVLESAAAVLSGFVDQWQKAVAARPGIVAVGGGSQRTQLLQLKADVMGRPISTPAHDEAAGIGALRLAAMAIRHLSPQDACALFANPVVRTLRPAVSDQHPAVHEG
jgi:xylulokinase